MYIFGGNLKCQNYSKTKRTVWKQQKYTEKDSQYTDACTVLTVHAFVYCACTVTQPLPTPQYCGSPGQSH